MPDVWKEVLCQGRQRDKTGRWFSYGPRHIQRADRNVSRMLSRGVPIPAVWEHQDVEAGDPEEWKAQYAKKTFGHIIGRRINSRGNLDLLHRVPDPEDRKQLAKVRFCSPKVYPSGYSDSLGGEYRGTTIAHVAATPTPVQTWQRPWPVQLSRGEALYLSYSPEGPTVADEADDKGKKTPKDDEGGGATSELNDIMEALRGKGLMISDKVSTWRELLIAIESSGDADNEPELDDDLPAEPTGGETVPGGGAPMMMSDDRAKGYAKREKIDHTRRVNRLFNTGRVTRVVAKSLLRRVGGQELSFTKAGDLVKTDTVHRIEAYEELPAWSAWSPKGKRPGAADDLSTTEVPAPDELTGGNAGEAAVVAKQEELAKKYSGAGAKAK